MSVINKNCFDVLKDMPSDSVDYTITSPPYNRKRNDKYNFYNDDLVNYDDFLIALIDESIRVSREFAFINVQKNYYNKKDVFRIIGLYADKISELIIWRKTNPMPANARNITNGYEFFIALNKKGKSLKANSTYTQNIFDTAVYSENPYKDVHRAVMKPEACAYIVDSFVNPKSLIFDPMAGLGTTGIVAKERGHRFKGIEISEEYCHIANERIAQVERRPIGTSRIKEGTKQVGQQIMLGI